MDESPSQYSSVIESFDHMMHQILSVELFHERRFTKAQIKELLRAPEHSDRNYLLKLILDREPFLSQHFSKEKLEKLSLLWIAVMGYYHKSAELLVCLGADVNEICGMDQYLVPVDHKMRKMVVEHKSTVLHVLFMMKRSRENKRFIRLVIDHGADLQVRDHNKRTVLHLAVSESRVQMVEMLLEKGADVNAADADGETPLLAASANRKAGELVPLLIKHGADVFAKDCCNQNVLHYLPYAPEEQAVDLARIFIEKGVPLDDKNSGLKYQPIHVAASNGANKLVDLFLDHGADVNALTKDDKSPLYLAVQYVKPTVLETLIKRGANINLRATQRLFSALHIACYNFREETVKILLSAGADVLAEDCDGKTPLALINLENMENPSIKLMIKALAMKKVCLSSAKLEYERIIERYPDLWKYYQERIKEIESMKCTKFIETCTFLELFTKCECQIAKLMRNPNFETNFRQNYLNGTFMYTEEILRAFERAQNHYHAMLEQEDVINEAVYYMLPYLIVWKIIRYTFDCCGKTVRD